MQFDSVFEDRPEAWQSIVDEAKQKYQLSKAVVEEMVHDEEDELGRLERLGKLGLVKQRDYLERRRELRERREGGKGRGPRRGRSRG